VILDRDIQRHLLPVLRERHQVAVASVEYCAFENLKRLEARNTFETGVLKPADSADPESFKVRKGKVGGHTEYLSAADVAYIDRVIEESGFDFAKFLET